MKTPTKKELYAEISYLRNEIEKMRLEQEKELREKWEQNKDKAFNQFYIATNDIFPNAVKNVNFEHVDKSGFWFTFELINDKNRQTYVVRHNEIEQ